VVHEYPVHYSRGVHLPAAAVWIDATQKRDLAVVSHAHGDHIAGHRAVICTEATFRVLAHRVRRPIEPHLLAFGERMGVGDAIVSLHPAGHVLGSSQVLVEHRGLRILYSGDIRVRNGHTAEPLEHVDCDMLIVESTFGHPHYRFPSLESTTAQITGFCHRALAEDRVPVLLAYSLGKGQELLATLRDSGLRVLLHRSIHAIAHLYRGLGVDLPHAGCFDDADGDVRSCVVVVPPHLRGTRAVQRLAPLRMAVLTGWAVDPGTALRMNCHSAFPLSDHADFDELIEYVQRSGARRVLTVHGFADEFAHQLRRRGIDASPLKRPEQLALQLA
jgi:Cft2 family RNA processing exonuclease